MLSVIPGVKVVGEAGNSYEALNIFDKVKPHVAIIDIKMPGESGVEVLKKMKKKNPSVIAIVLTNHPYTQYRAKCFENGADYFFDKSEEYNKVIDVLDDLIKNGSLNHVAVN
jgi:DNA-binding NarL/FixJ family response regulator